MQPPNPATPPDDLPGPLPGWRLAAAAPPPPAASTQQMQQLVQELQVSKVELELQQQELLQAQEQTETSRAQYAELYNAAPVGYCSLSRSGVLRLVNNSTSQLLGKTAAQLLGRSLAMFVDLDGLARYGSFLKKLWASPGQHSSDELSLRHPSGRVRRVLVEGVASLGNADLEQEAGYHLVLFDITDRHTAAEVLTASESRFRASFEQSHDGMLLLENNLLADANHAALRRLGLSHRSQLLGQLPSTFWPAVQPGSYSTQEAFARCVEQAEQQGWCRLELLRYDQLGEELWDELSFNPIMLNQRNLMHVGWRDITVRKRTEEQLRRSEAHLRQALDAADTGVWSLDLEDQTVHPDARAQEIFGVGAGVPFALLQAVVHPADLPQMQQALSTASSAYASFDIEHRLLRPDGSVRHVAVTGSFEYGITGTPRRLRGLVRDVTARHLAKVELDYKNRLLHNLLRNVPIVLTRIDRDGRYREHTGSPLRRLHIADNELVGQRLADLFPDSSPHIERLLAGEPVNYTSHVQYNGRHIHLQIFGFYDTESQEGILFGSDITEAENLKEEAARLRLRQQQELHTATLTTQEEERRRIAESLHNGVGQLLYATRLHLDLLPPSEQLRAGQDLLTEAIRATRTVSFELTPPVLSDFGLPTALRELLKRIPAGSLAIDLHLHNLDEPLPAALQIAVYRIVQELLNNVIKHAQAQEVFVSVARDNDLLHVSVEDDGRGFELPLPGQSTGIGLASISTRAELLGGTLEVKSRPGRGSNVFLQLPVRPLA